MSDFIKQKQVQNLTADLGNKAVAADVLHKASNLSDVSNLATARTNLDVHSKSEVNTLISGAENALSVADLTARNALANLKVGDRVFVSNDGDDKWAMYIVTAITDGGGATSTFEKVADQDLFDNAMTAAAVKAAYESNADTNAFTDAEKAKVAHISVSQAVDLDDMEGDIATNAANITTAQTAANNAQSTANSKEDNFTEVRETFTGMNVEAGMDNEINVANNIKAGFDVLVFFGVLRVDNVSWNAGATAVTINMPYLTEVADEIHIIYKY